MVSVERAAFGILDTFQVRLEGKIIGVNDINHGYNGDNSIREEARSSNYLSENLHGRNPKALPEIYNNSSAPRTGEGQ